MSAPNKIQIPISKKLKVKKRDGILVAFRKDSIVRGIFKAADSVGGKNKKRAEEIAEEVIKIINDIYPKKGRLLLNAGPDKYGVIPEYQVEILKKVGER